MEWTNVCYKICSSQGGASNNIYLDFSTKLIKLLISYEGKSRNIKAEKRPRSSGRCVMSTALEKQLETKKFKSHNTQIWDINRVNLTSAY